jgi:hypothetical protein
VGHAKEENGTLVTSFAYGEGDRELNRLFTLKAAVNKTYFENFHRRSDA